MCYGKLTFSALTTTKIKVTVSAAADNVARLMEVEAWSGSNPGTPPKNMALVSNGGVATAQNYTQDGYYPGQDFHFQPSYANDGTRYMGANGDHYWRDEHGVPTWIEVAFSGPKTIDEIDVFTCRDDYATQTDPSATQTFSNYGTTSFQVQYWNPDTSGWTVVSGGSFTGNNLVWRKITFSAVTTTKIKVTVSAAADNVARLMEVEAWSGSNPGTPAKNMALVSNGGVATAQNYTQDGYYPGQDFHFQPLYANDGTRYMGANGDRYWRDEHGVPTWIEVAFSGAKTIDEIDVFTCRDDYATQTDPSATQTFSNYGTTSFQVQYWNPDTSGWTAVPGGSFSGNNLVWRKLTFSAVTTTKIKVTISATPDNVARLMEVEAWGYETANVHWLVPDHLGTPRLVVDQSGSLSGLSRHDYLPFGEELFGGGRTATQGDVGDSVRQRFAGSERDGETGMDYMKARYYSSVQGRFTSFDPLFVTLKRLIDPQRLNLYAYARNNPLKFTDPDGTDITVTAENEEDAKKRFQVFLLGLPPNDRKHVQFFVGDGKDGYKKGEFYIKVEKDHKSKSENVGIIQKAANDRTALGKLTVVRPGESYKMESLSYENDKEVRGVMDVPLGENDFDGYTFFEYRGKTEQGIITSGGPYSEMIINGKLDDIEMTATMHHEMRHLVVGDFGRKALEARESLIKNDLNKTEKEARENARKP